jgi:hypothetical protein
LGNEARRELVRTELRKQNKSAKEVYSHEVKGLESKLRDAEKNAPLERQAQVVARNIYSEKKRANPDMEKDEERKIKGQALEEARLRTGAKKQKIELTDREWEAIQAGAISNSMLGKILNHTDLDKLRERATPRDRPVMSSILTSRAKRMLDAGATLEEVADQLDVNLSTLKSSLKED